jgi:predicted alpha/beta hydrolase
MRYLAACKGSPRNSRNPQHVNAHHARTTGALAAAAASGTPRCEYEVLERKLQALAGGGRKLYFTGHSIGAGLAGIFTQALHARCGRQSACRIVITPSLRAST